VNDMLFETPSVEQLSRIIGNVAAPAFLLGAVAAFISVRATTLRLRGGFAIHSRARGLSCRPIGS
jgi:hypothetical protein